MNNETWQDILEEGTESDTRTRAQEAVDAVERAIETVRSQAESLPQTIQKAQDLPDQLNTLKFIGGAIAVLLVILILKEV
jgi:septation ring formation regulator EzrA